jgi:hypothetical protein
VQARTARLGRARGASSDLILCSSTALTSHSKLCPLLCPVLSPSSCSVKNVAVNCPSRSHQRKDYHTRPLPASYPRPSFLSARARDQIDYSTTIMPKVFSSRGRSLTTLHEIRSAPTQVSFRLVVIGAHCKVRCSVVRFLSFLFLFLFL